MNSKHAFSLRFIVAFCCLVNVPFVFAADEVRVGVIVPLTGEAASIGVACRNGIDLSLKKLSPLVRNRIKVRLEDDQNDPRKTLSAFKILHSEKLDVVVTFSSGTSKAIAPLSEHLKIPLIAIASDPDISKGRSYAVNFWVSPRQQAKVLLNHLQQRKLIRIARISAVQAGMLAMKEAFDDLSRGQLQIVVDEEYSTAERDFRTFLAKVAQHKEIDALFVNLYVGQTGVFAKQAREMGISLPLVNIETFESPSDVQVSQGALLGQNYVQADDAVSSFSDEYKSSFPSDSPFTAGNCHDALSLIAEAIRREEPLNDYLHSVKSFQGAMGTFSAVGDGTFSLPATMKRVTESGFEILP